MMKFEISEDEYRKGLQFEKEQCRKLIEWQSENIEPTDPCYDEYVTGWASDYPYMGAIGGGLTWSFTPTSIGTIITVEWCKGTDFYAKKDVTDYDLW